MERTKVVIEFGGEKREVECDGIFGVVYGEKDQEEIRQLLIGRFSINTISYCLNGIMDSFVGVMREEGVDEETIFQLVILSISNAFIEYGIENEKLMELFQKQVLEKIMN